MPEGIKELVYPILKEELIPALADTFRELDAVLANGFRSAELTSLMEQLKKMTDNACAANEELK